MAPAWHDGQQAAAGRQVPGRRFRGAGHTNANALACPPLMPLPTSLHPHAARPCPASDHFPAGLSDADWPSVAAFYAYWSSFGTVKDFTWADQYHTGQAPNRKVGAYQMRRWGMRCALLLAPQLRPQARRTGGRPPLHARCGAIQQRERSEEPRCCQLCGNVLKIKLSGPAVRRCGARWRLRMKRRGGRPGASTTRL